jgi:folate-binding protein YgfZ
MSTLQSIHESLAAEFQPWGDLQVVSTYGNLPLEYAAIHRSAALIDMPQRGILQLEGEGRLEFLNRVLTQQLISRSGQALAAGEGCFSFLLTPKGRLIAEMNILHAAESTWIECDRQLLPPVRQTLDRYLFREALSIRQRDDLGALALVGVRALPLLRELTALPAADWPHLHSCPCHLGDVAVTAFTDLEPGPPAVYLYAPATELPALWLHLLRTTAPQRENVPRPLVPAGWAAFNAARIEVGRRLMGIDYDGDFLPAETGQEHRAVSFDKGCYPGQEIVARMKSHQQCARQVVGLRIDGGELPLAGAHVLTPDDQPVGVVTSSTLSPRLGNAALCLAALARPHFATGASLRALVGEKSVTATVVETPFA